MDPIGAGVHVRICLHVHAGVSIPPADVSACYHAGRVMT